MIRRLIDLQPVVLLTLLLLAIVGVQALFPKLVTARELNQLLVWVLMIAALYTYVGLTGIVSFGHTAFSAIAAYVAAALTMKPIAKTAALYKLPEWILAEAHSPLLGFAAGVVVATLVAIPIGLAIGRLRGEAITIGTFTFLLITYAVFANWDGVTGGSTALVGIPLALGTWPLLTMVVAVLVIINGFRLSRWGRMLQAAREDPVAAQASGVNVTALRLLAFVLSGMLMAVAGIAQIYTTGVVSVASFYLGTTSIAIAMLVLGGRNSLSGAVVGAVLISLAITFLRRAERGVSLGPLDLALPAGAQEMMVGALLLAMLLLMPNGIMGYRELALRIGKKRPGKGETP